MPDLMCDVYCRCFIRDDDLAALCLEVPLKPRGDFVSCCVFTKRINALVINVLTIANKVLQDRLLVRVNIDNTFWCWDLHHALIFGDFNLLDRLTHDLFGDILPPRIWGRFWWSMGLGDVIKLIGLEALMTLPYDDPEFLHDLLDWLCRDHLHFIKWLETEGLLTLNNENGYTGSGGVAYTRELPRPDWSEGSAVRLKDLRGFAESQETVGTSPEMFAEFILLEQFGMNCYGCCEPVHGRWKYIKGIPNLRRISVSPWCDQEIMARALGKDYIFSRKPNPAPLCVDFDQEVLREDLRRTLEIASDCNLEIIMKDTHTVQYDPTRIGRWVSMAFEEVQKAMAKN